MLKLQLKNRWPNRYTYLAKLCAISLLLHVFLLLCLFFSWGPPTVTLAILGKTRIRPANIVLVPWLKNIPGSLQAIAKMQPSATMQKQPVATKQTNACKKIKKEQKNIKKMRKSKKEMQQLLQQATQLLQTKEKQKTIKKQLKKDAIKKEEPKKVIPQKNKEQISPTPVQQPQTKQPTAIKQDHVVTQTGEAPMQNNAPEQIFVGREEWAMLHDYQEIQQAIEQQWHPPAGLSKELSCTVAVMIDAAGKVQDIQVSQSSQVLAYDAAACSALAQVTFAHQFWNKQIVITFQQ